RLDATRLRYPPGEGWCYSNVGYLYVVRLIERLTGLGLAEALAQRALAPLGLKQARLAGTPADLQWVNLGAITVYDPRWVYHGLLVGPLAEAAIWLERLLSGQLLPSGLLQEMQRVKTLGGPLAGRPWQAPGYALGLMQGPVNGGLVLSGHTGGGPGSVVAVYRAVRGEGSASCAVFHAGSEQGVLEDEVVTRLLAAWD
ncbi:serine hydrolase, partial [Pseudomonas sp. BMS12]|uniref:serine hydrolase n=1 Tax=Pseudomonas sp. BMS12 TaxID=1796033 RepID=UPI00083AAC52